jgi:uncharacterized protein
MTEEGVAKKGSYWLKAATIVVVAVGGFVILGPFVGGFLAYPFYDGTPMSFLEDLSNPMGKENMKVLSYVVQAGATFIGLGVVPAYYWRRATGVPLTKMFAGPRIDIVDVVLVGAIVIFFMGFNSIFIEWNSKVDLPDFMSGLERWARTTEDMATELTKYLTEFSNPGQFILGFFVIAVLASFSEELVFRGMLQPTLQRATGNVHAGIWISAILFSCMHLQLYGFVPRVFLGALFGYMYYWSGNLLVPMIGHFVNNGLQVVMIYLNQTEVTALDLESPEALPWPVVIGFTVITVALLWFYKKRQALKTLPA